jgi:hypothetical protein
MISRIRSSLQWNLFFSYCRFLERRKAKRGLLRPWKAASLSASAVMGAIVYLKDIPVLLNSLRSIQQHHTELPRLIIYGDTVEALEMLRQLLGGEPDVETRYWEEAFAQLTKTEAEFIRTWQGSGRWGGYAKKYAITLALQKQHDLILTDGDVLWFEPQLPAFSEKLRGQKMWIGEDYMRSYDFPAGQTLGEERLQSATPVNCGFVLYPRGVLSEHISQSNYQALMPNARAAGNHLEQSLVATAFWRSGGNILEKRELATTMSDNLSWRSRVQCAVRHYAGGKHLFWRDC